MIFNIEYLEQQMPCQVERYNIYLAHLPDSWRVQLDRID